MLSRVGKPGGTAQISQGLRAIATLGASTAREADLALDLLAGAGAHDDQIGALEAVVIETPRSSQGGLRACRATMASGEFQSIPTQKGTVCTCCEI